MNNIKNAIYVISKLDFNDLAVGAKPSTIKDNNSGVDLKWTVSEVSGGEIKEVNGVNILNFKTNNYKLFTTVSGVDLKNGSIQFEADILLPSVKSDNIFFNVANSSNTGFRFNIRNTFKNGLEVLFGTSRVAFNFLFESNKKYNIVVSKDYNVYSLYIDGMIIGHCVSNDFTNLISVGSSPTLTLGAKTSSYTSAVDEFIGEISNVNISFGMDSNKYSNSFTKYGDHLISRLNFGNLASASSATVFTPGLEAVHDSKMTWVYGGVTASGEFGMLDGSPFSSSVGDVGTIYFTMNTGKNVSDIELVNFNDQYKVIYTFNVEGAPQPVVVINDYTTSALDFENGLVDKVGTTLWTKEGIANVTDVNTIFGNSSFETKALGDGLSTTSTLITGGATPYTIEFYALIKSDNLQTLSSFHPILTSKHLNGIGGGSQGLYLNKTTNQFMYQRTTDVEPNFGVGGNLNFNNNKIAYNEINKITITFDGVALRFFINDVLDYTIGTLNGHYARTFFHLYSHPAAFDNTTKGIIDNINVFDGIATKVRAPDPNEEFLVVDLAFDGENNSTKIVDNGTLKSNWTVSGSAKISTTQKFDGFSSLYLDGSGDYISNNKPFNLGVEDFTISCSFISLSNEAKVRSIVRTVSVPNNPYSFYIGIEDDNTLKFLLYDYDVTQALFNKSSNIIIQTNREYKLDVLCENNIISVYVNGIVEYSELIGQRQDVIAQAPICIGYSLGGSNNRYFNGYIKNFKIYKGVAVIPEDPTGKIQLDFDNNLVDKYSNSTWTNNGVTFDQVNSVKGHAAYFNGSNSILSISNNQNLNFENKNFVLSYDFKNAIFDSVNNRYLLGNGMALAHGAFWRLFGTSSSKSGSVNLNYNSTNYGLTHTVEVENNYYNEKILRNSDTLVGFKNDVAISALNVINTFNVDFKNMSIGTASSLTDGVSYFNGYLDNFKTYKEDLINIKLDQYGTNATTSVSNEILKINFNPVGNGSYHTFKFKDAPILKNFIAEIETIVTAGNTNYTSIVFRTSDYSLNNMDKFGYVAYITGNLIRFGKGSNKNTASWTKLGEYALTTQMADGNVHKLKVIANDSNFKMYYDDYLIIDVNDTSYTNASPIGHVFYNFITGLNPNIKSLALSDLNNNLIYSNNFKSKIDNVIDRPAVHLPLETNAINTGFAQLTINSVGNPTYTTIDGKKCIKFESEKYLTINSNNIFNLGTNSDFYIELDVYVPVIHVGTNGHGIFGNNTNWDAIGSNRIEIISMGSTRKIKSVALISRDSNNIQTVLESEGLIIENSWNNIVIRRTRDTISISVNDIVSTFQNSLNIDYSKNGTHLGQANNATGNSFDGYISNFKMFVGTSEIPETYNDKKVLDLDFKPTGKSYLFKDNNNKCVIHPVNITQRDYQDSQYCCTFNGTNQYLQLGKNDLLNFGYDDFVINIKFKIYEYYNGNSSYFLLHSGESVSTNERFLIGVSGTSNGTESKKIHFITTSNNITQSIFGGEVPLNQINDLLIYRSGGVLYLKLNDDIISKDFNYSINGNLENNTLIGYRKYNSTTFFKGTIYSIKVLRNTTDLSLLDEETTVYASEEKFTLTNGTEAETIEFTEIKDRDVKIVTDNDKVTLKVDDNEVEIPKTTTISNIELFKDYTSQIKDVRVYDIPLQDDDEFLGSELIDTQYPELEMLDDDEELQVIDVGDFVIKGFIEGGVGRNYIIRNKVENFELIKGTDDYFYDGIDERYIDNYEIYEVESKQSYPLPKHVMERGVISGVVDTARCSGSSGKIKPSDMTAWCYSNKDQRLIGSYPVSMDGTYLIPNLDVHTRYDIIFKHNNRLIENISSSYRKPKRVEDAKNPRIIGIDYEYNQNSSFIKYTWQYSTNVTFSSVKLYITENPIIDSTTPFIELGNNMNHYNDYNVTHNHQYYVTIVATYEGNEYRSTQMLVNTHDRTPTVITSVGFNKTTGNVLITW